MRKVEHIVNGRIDIWAGQNKPGDKPNKKKSGRLNEPPDNLLD